MPPKTPRRPLRALALGLFLVLSATLPAEDPSTDIVRQFDVGIELSDGVRLSGDLYRPPGSARVPVVVTRTPYDNSGARAAEEGEFFARHGYAYLTVDSRGRYDSEGDFYPYRSEARDGDEVIAWAAAQPWSDGRVVTLGGSYLGFDQWLAAAESPPALRAMVVMVAPVDYYDSPAHTGGAFNLGGRLPWTTLVDARTNQNLMAHEWGEGLDHLPVATADGAIGRELETFRDWALHADRDDYWASYTVEGRWQEVGVPVLHQGGWYDEFVRGTLRGYTGMRGLEVDESVRADQRLLIGPWTHGMSMGPQVGQVDFGEHSQLDHRELALRFFDHHLREGPPPFEGRVRLYVMGESAWREFDDWPVPGARQSEWFLRAEGALSPEAPGEETPDRYRYDPGDPVPTTGGGTCCVYAGFYPEIMPWGPWDQREVESRPDVVVYSTPPLTEPLTVVGPVRARLFVATSASDTDFTAKLVDVHPDGTAINLADGILRLRYRNSTERPELATPGEVYEIEIDLSGTANTFKAGHQVRLEIASSNFPWYDRNLNTGEHPAKGKRWQVADQTIFHDTTRPSRLVLPVVDSEPQPTVALD
jgi:putative CocE/NonD family hydrolase